MYALQPLIAVLVVILVAVMASQKLLLMHVPVCVMKWLSFGGWPF